MPLRASLVSLVVTSAVMLAPGIGRAVSHQADGAAQVSMALPLIRDELADAGLRLWPVAAANVLVVAAAVDATCRIIPNQLVLPSLLAGLLLACREGALASALLGGAVGFLILFVPHQMRRGALGFGDVKLAALIGTATGIDYVVLSLFAGGIAGGLYGIGLLLARRAGLKDAVPYGPCLALGGIVGLWCMAAGIRV
jgi:prepilin signal peptidase PulO-like enzyme (type II secretory pathway)